MKVLQVGMGPVAHRVTRYLSERPAFDIKGAVDTNPDLIGHDIGEIAGISSLGIEVEGDLKQALKTHQPDIAVLTTASTVQQVEPTLSIILSSGVNVVTSCEELFFALPEQNKLVAKLDRTAKEHKVSFLGTGINPGFLMDYLPIVLSSLHQKVDSVYVERIQDASARRIPFQKKIGAGLSEEEFAKRVASKTLRHVGLTESLAFLLHYLKIPYTKLEETLEPVKGGKDITGVLQVALATNESGEQVGQLLFKAAMGEKDPRDRIILKGEPHLEMILPGAVHGDVGTCAMLINAIPSVIQATPGYKTMADIMPPHFFRS